VLALALVGVLDALAIVVVVMVVTVMRSLAKFAFRCTSALRSHTWGTSGTIGGCGNGSSLDSRSGRGRFTGLKIFQIHIIHAGIEVEIVKITFNQVVRVGILHGKGHHSASVGEDSNESKSGCRRHI